MFSPKLSDVRTVLCLGAHSDDIEIGCGGTLLKLMQQHGPLNVCWVVLSGEGPRADEARNSADHFLQAAGESDVRIEGFRDSYFPAQYETIKDYFHQLSRSVRPDLVFTHRREDWHQDHRLVNELTWNAFRSHLILEYEIPKYEGDLGKPNVFVPLEEAECQQKVTTLSECFGTQRSKGWFTEDTFWSLLRLRGLECAATTRYAEAFTCRKMTL